MKKKVISMFLTACTVSVMVVGGGSNLVMADDAETVTLMGWYDEDDMNPILEKVNEQRIDTNTSTGSNCDHQVLHRKCKRNCSKCTLT